MTNQNYKSIKGTSFQFRRLDSGTVIIFGEENRYIASIKIVNGVYLFTSLLPAALKLFILREVYHQEWYIISDLGNLLIVEDYLDNNWRKRVLYEEMNRRKYDNDSGS